MGPSYRTHLNRGAMTTERNEIVIVGLFAPKNKILNVHVTGTPTRNQNRMSPTMGETQSRADNFGDRQFVVIASEKQARVVALPSQTCVYRQQIADTDFVVKAETISVKGA